MSARNWNVCYGDEVFEWLINKGYGSRKIRMFYVIVGSYKFGSRPRQINYKQEDFKRIDSTYLNLVRNDLVKDGIIRKVRRAKGSKRNWVYGLNPYFWMPSMTKMKRVQLDWDECVFESYELWNEYKSLSGKFGWTEHEVVGLWK